MLTNLPASTEKQSLSATISVTIFSFVCKHQNYKSTLLQNAERAVLGAVNSIWIKEIVRQWNFSLLWVMKIISFCMFYFIALFILGCIIIILSLFPLFSVKCFAVGNLSENVTVVRRCRCNFIICTGCFSWLDLCESLVKSCRGKANCSFSTV